MELEKPTMAKFRSLLVSCGQADPLAIPASENSSEVRKDCFSSCDFYLFAPWLLIIFVDLPQIQRSPFVLDVCCVLTTEAEGKRFDSTAKYSAK